VRYNKEVLKQFFYVVRPLRPSRYKRLAILILGISCLFTLTGFLGSAHWLLDLTSHFRIQYLLVQCLAMVLLLAYHREILAVTVVPFLLVNMMQMVPFYLPSPAMDQASPPVTHKIRVLQMNVSGWNQDHKKVKDYIHSVNPDIIAFEEFHSGWRNYMTAVGALKAYPYFRVVRSPSTDIAVYSRFPARKILVYNPDSGDEAVLVALLNVHGQPVTVLVVHPRLPLTPEMAKRQWHQFRVMAHVQKFFGGKTIVLGDFNTTPWSVAFRHYIQESGLYNTQNGFGVLPSWPAFLGFPWIPIDHVLVSQGFVVLNRHSGPYVGSDHYPVDIELGLTGSAR
jgi:endonuclease/exonuclease/phosphatase (EEP) superfamily protein YafD